LPSGVLFCCGQLLTSKWSSPDGASFRAQGLDPDQSIFRTLNPAWETAKPPYNISKFSLRPQHYENVPYWGLYDLLGLFLSLIGPAPVGATKKNFYVPLTATYGRWCAKIGDRLSYMFNCCWSVRENQQDTFSLGASLGGYMTKKRLTGCWHYVCQRGRFSLVDGEPLKLAGWTFGDSPCIRDGGHVSFGNCAETYPFIRLLK
jgi:hypothetical protein